MKPVALNRRRHRNGSIWMFGDSVAIKLAKMSARWADKPLAVAILAVVALTQIKVPVFRVFSLALHYRFLLSHHIAASVPRKAPEVAGIAVTKPLWT